MTIKLADEVKVEELIEHPGLSSVGPDTARVTGEFSWENISLAQKHYEGAGYRRESVPWVVSPAAFHATVPPHVTRYYETLGGFLVASAEQGFLQRMMDGAAPAGPAQASSPCFRDELVSDERHQPYFLKVELFDPQVSACALERMVFAGVEFFSGFVEVEVVRDGPGLDIVTKEGGVELGSYGLRSVSHDGRVFKWTYGTGVAEPRLSQVLGLFTPARGA